MKKLHPQLRDIVASRVINKSSAIPLHYQLEQFLREGIANGRFAVHATLPTEQDLQDHFDLSRTPIRQALSHLVADGLVARRRSQGTVVLPKPFEEDLRSLSSFTEEVHRKQQTPSARLITFSIQPADSNERRILELDLVAQVYRIQRVRLIDNEPAGLVTSLVPVERVPALDPSNFSEYGVRQSMYYVLEQVHQIKLVRATEVFDAVNLDDEAARLLRLEPQSAILARNRVSYDSGGRPIAYERGLYRARYHLNWVGREISVADPSATTLVL